MDRKRPIAIDLFAGAGLLSYAFKKAGFEIALAVEQDQTASETYRLNLGDHIIVSDVRSIEPHGKCDVLIGGPPCQGFSTLGKRDVNDPRNSLSLEMAKWAKALDPKIVVIENVNSFINSPAYRALVSKLRRIGYKVQSHILNAADFGVPQNRLRSFTIASKVGFPSEIKGQFSEKPVTVRQALCGLPTKPDGENHHYSPRPTGLALSRMKVIPSKGDKRDVMKNAPELVPPSWWKVSGDVTDVWGRMDWDKPCNTLRTCLQNASKGRYIHPDQNRVISLREAARLHSIPDDWKFNGLPTQIARQIGNSVPPMLGYSVAESIHSIL